MTGDRIIEKGTFYPNSNQGEPVPPWPPRLQRPCFLQIQKQSFKDDFQNQCSLKFRKFHKKTPVLESLVNKVTDRKAYNFIKKRLHQRCFPVKFAKLFTEHLFSQHTSGGCFCRSSIVMLIDIAALMPEAS